MKYIRWFNEITLKDIAQVGGKTASLGQMIHDLQSEGIEIPAGFALTAQAYWDFLEQNKLLASIKRIMRELNSKSNLRVLQRVGKEIRALIKHGTMPDSIQQELSDSYEKLSALYKEKQCAVAVRSSATAEDLPTASFAGQQETFLNVRGSAPLIEAAKHCMASLFTDRAITYRIENSFNHFDVALSVGVQKMIRSTSSGVAFSLDTETGFKNVIMIESAWGLGESIVQGLVTPDEFYVFKPTLDTGDDPIIKNELGEKKIKMIYGTNQKNPIKKVATSAKERATFSLTNADVVALARMVNSIEKLYTRMHKKWTPMDVEWAKSADGTLYILQARPETVHSQKKESHVFKTYTLLKPSKKEIISGMSIGQKIVSGIARVIKDVGQINAVKPGEIIITSMTDPDWVPVMKQVAGIITDLGGRTCHAAIVSRELGKAAIVGTGNATKLIKNGQKITMDCSTGSIGYVYDGILPFKEEEIDLQKIPKLSVELMVNVADPDNAFSNSMLPVAGVGLARMEFIITNAIKIHPMALIDPKKVKNKKLSAEINKLTALHKNKKQFFIDTLAQGIAMIAAAFYPRPVIVRLSDFKTNEYRNLLGGEYFEQEEANPMLGFRGASRYTHPLYKEAFALECAALNKVRMDMGLDNIVVMVPFVRTVPEAQQVIHEMALYGLSRDSVLKSDRLRKSKRLEIVMMCEVPSNVILINEFSKLFDGFSIGSNDLTQLVLGVDRDSALLADIFDERDPAVKQMIIQAIKGAHKSRRFIGICGQAPSDYPEFAEFLMKEKIDSISLNSDSVLPFLMRF